jgi:hypothetical protein
VSKSHRKGVPNYPNHLFLIVSRNREDVTNTREVGTLGLPSLFDAIDGRDAAVSPRCIDAQPLPTDNARLADATENQLIVPP